VGRLSERLKKHALIALDTSVFIYHLEANPTYLPLTSEILAGVQSGQWLGVTSVITLMELTVPAWRQEREAVAREYEVLLVNFPNLEVVEISREVARKAAQLRARYGVRPADALQVSAGLAGGASCLVTNDRGLSRLAEVIEVVVLEDYIPGG
jgi:predicted nucleic acid-binding protein